MSKPVDPHAGATLADAEAALRKGKGSSLFIIGALGVAILAGLLFLIGGDDQARVYGELGKRINGIKRSQFDQFWACALPGENLAALRSNNDLAAHLDARGRERGRPYGIHLRDHCLPTLEKVAPELESLIVPQDLQAPIIGLTEANGQLRGAVSEFVAYLDDRALEYDSDAARPLLVRIARGWYDFKKSHNEVNALIKDKLK